MEKATFGAGCFWKTEDAFRQLKSYSYLVGTINKLSPKLNLLLITT
jgi:peptide methionine sulfoxide reductase MsrA